MSDFATSETTNHLPVAIIGYGTAGVNAAIALRNAGYGGRIQVFSETDILPYSPILTSYYAAGEKTYEQCFPWEGEALADLGLEVMAGCPAVELDPDAHVIHTAQGDFPYAKCVVATGARPLVAGFPQAGGEGGYEPLVLRTMEDAERFKAALEREDCRRVLVSGASMIALKSVEACLRQGVQVELVGRAGHVLDMSALPVAAERFERGLRAKGVGLRLGQTITAVKRVGEGKGLAVGSLEVMFSNGDVELYDEILVAHGMRSDLSFVKGGSLEIDRALVVDEFMRTSDPDVYAAGDVAQALELVSGEKRVLGIWRTAALQGACAGAAIAAEVAGNEPAAGTAYAGAISSNTIAVDGTLFISGGDVSSGEGREVELRETDDMTVACVYEVLADGADAGASGATRRLVGFNVVCDRDEPGGLAYDVGAMLTMRIESTFRKLRLG